MKPLRVMLHSVAPFFKSGFGVIGRPFLKGIRELPCVEAVAGSAYWGLQGGIMLDDGIPWYPAGYLPYGNDVMAGHCQHFNADLIISLVDAWVLKDVAARVAPTKWLPWSAIDAEPVPQRWLDPLKGAHRILTYSRWGVDMLRRAGVHAINMPLGIEPEVYRVLPDEARRKARAITGLPADCFLACMVAGNITYPDRKAFVEQFTGFALFLADHPDAYLYCHTEPEPPTGGVNLRKLAASLGISERVRFPDRYEYMTGLIDGPGMATMYNASDVLLACAHSEGFGLPIIEAQACGLPAIVNDFSSMPELVRWGQVVEVGSYEWADSNGGERDGSWRARPDEGSIKRALEWAYQDRQSGLANKRQIISDVIHGQFAWGTLIRKYWQPLLEELAEEAGWKAPPLRMMRNGKRLQGSAGHDETGQRFAGAIAGTYTPDSRPAWDAGRSEVPREVVHSGQPPDGAYGRVGEDNGHGDTGRGGSED